MSRAATLATLAGLTAAGTLVVSTLAGCGGDPTDGYCGAVRDHQQELGRIVGSGDQDALLQAADILRDLRDKAPGDIRDEYQQVVSSADALRDAADAAGVDPATYDRRHPPAGLSAAEKARIDAAAKQVGSAATLAAFQDIDQEVRDVCQTPLTA
jgi:hypothetical protein